MRVCRISISNFRGISAGTVLLPKHTVLIGDNNVGKTTILEALDLTLGPDRLNRQPPIDEHDFFRGKYLHDAAPQGVPDAPLKSAPAAANNNDAHQQGVDDEGDALVGPAVEIEVTIVDPERRAKGQVRKLRRVLEFRERQLL